MESNLSPSDKNKVGVYLLHNKDTNEVYVGSGKLSKRQEAHKRNLSNNKHINYKLQKSFNKSPNFEFIASPIDIEGLGLKENRTAALILEQIIVDKLKDNDLLLNIAMKVDNPSFGVKLSEETKAKISKNSKDMWNNMSEEQIKERNKKISEKLLDHWSSLSEKEKEERTEIIRHASIGRQLSEEHRQKVGDFFRGTSLSEDHKRKIGEGNKGKIISPETIDKFVATRRANNSFKANENQKLSASKQVVIDGETFPSITEAAKLKGVCRDTITKRLNDPNYINWKRKSDDENNLLNKE